jgi:O-antigen/teichoic acid export membrane protein
LNAVSGLGSDVGLLRWVPRQIALDDHGSARRTVPVALVPVVAVACVAALALILSAPALADMLGGGRIVPMLRVLAVFLPVAAAHDAVLAATRAHGTMRPTVAIEKIFRQVAQVGGVLAASLFTTDPVGLALAFRT